MKTLTRYFIFLSIQFIALSAFAQTYKISGRVTLKDSISAGATVTLSPGNLKTASDNAGYFEFKNLTPGNYTVAISYLTAGNYRKQVKITDADVNLSVKLSFTDNELDEVSVIDKLEKQASGNLKQVEGTAIYAGKKTEVVNIANQPGSRHQYY
jgi:Fe(3+) dicitrate transport protein